MKAMIITPAKDGALVQVKRPVPVPRIGEALIRVTSVGVNRADIFQAEGKYPAPEGADPDIPGLEVAGIVEKIGDNTQNITVGQPVCALLAGGGYAEYVTVPVEQLLPIPTPLTIESSAALPEACFTVWRNIFQLGQLKDKPSTVLIHAGASGIGMTAIQMAKSWGATVYATASNTEKHDFCKALGADEVWHYQDDFGSQIKALNNGKGADIILDMLGTDYLEKNLSALAYQGRLIVIALLNGSHNTLSMGRVLMKNLTIIGSTLRSLPSEDKFQIAKELQTYIWPFYESGKITPVIDKIFPLEQAQEALNYMQSRQHKGKILLKCRNS